MVPLLDLASCPDLLEESHGGLEDVGTLSKQGLQLLKVCELALRIKPSVSQASAHQGPVLTLYIAVVVLVVRTGTDNAPRLEEHLASWTKGCEGPKGSGVKRIP